MKTLLAIVDQIQCHESVALPIPTELRRDSYQMLEHESPVL